MKQRTPAKNRKVVPDDAIPSLRQLAPLVGRSPATVCAWVKREDWPFSRVPPWLKSDVPRIKVWAEETFPPDNAAEWRGDVREEQRVEEREFWSFHHRYAPIVLPDECRGSYESFRAEALAMPAEVCTPFERDVITGKRTLTADEVRDVVTSFVRTRESIVYDLGWIAPWLAGQPEREIAARLRGALYDRLAAFAQHVGGHANRGRDIGIFTPSPELEEEGGEE